MNFTITKIEREFGMVYQYAVTVKMDSDNKAFTVTCTRRQLLNFSAFQNLVFAATGRVLAVDESQGSYNWSSYLETTLNP